MSVVFHCLNKKILIFIDWYKPGFKAGGPIRSISNLVDYLHKDAEIYIITRNTDYLESVPYPNIQSNTWIHTDNASVNYLSKSNINYRNLKRLINEINPNLIYCNSFFSPYFTLIPVYISKKIHLKSIIAVRGMLSQGSVSIKKSKKRIFLLLSKILRIYKKVIFHATNTAEKNDISREFKNNTIIVAQNLPKKKNNPFFHKEKEIGKLKLISIGRIAPEKNTHYALELLKNVTSNIQFDIYGPIYSADYWNKCKEIINQLPPNIVVNYNGVLNHNKVDEVLKKYQGLLLPSTGENFGHIIIEAMINSCIPIISDKTPWIGLKEKNFGFDISLNNMNEFSDTINQLAQMDISQINEMSKNAHQFASNIINNDKVIEDYYKLFQLKN